MIHSKKYRINDFFGFFSSPKKTQKISQYIMQEYRCIDVSSWTIKTLCDTIAVSNIRDYRLVHDEGKYFLVYNPHGDLEGGD